MSDFKPVNQPIAPASADPGEEFPFLHTITVVDRVVSVDNPELVQNNIRTETVTLNLDSEWDGLSCIINIGSGETPTSIIWSGQPVTIPAELMTDIGTLNVSVVGYGDDGALRAVTKKADAMFTVVASGYVEGDEPVPDPTTILGQLTEAADRANQAAQNAEDSTIDKVNVMMLPTGSSASGSVSDKTLSLSIPNGPQGPKGDPGIQGPKGDPGIQGPKGDPGDLTTVAHDGTLTGDGTASKPLGAAMGSAVNQTYVFADGAFDLNNLTDFGIFSLNNDQHTIANIPATPFRGCVFVTNNGYPASNKSSISQVALCRNWSGKVEIYTRALVSGTWQKWERVAFASEVSAVTASISALEKKTNELAIMQTRLQALETRIKSLETN